MSSFLLKLKLISPNSWFLVCSLFPAEGISENIWNVDKEFGSIYAIIEDSDNPSDFYVATGENVLLKLFRENLTVEIVAGSYGTSGYAFLLSYFWKSKISLGISQTFVWTLKKQLNKIQWFRVEKQNFYQGIFFTWADLHFLHYPET